MTAGDGCLLQSTAGSGKTDAAWLGGLAGTGSQGRSGG